MPGLSVIPSFFHCILGSGVPVTLVVSMSWSPSISVAPLKGSTNSGWTPFGFLALDKKEGD